MMCTILIHVFLSAAAAILWCVMVMFLCLCVEHTVIKRKQRPRLSLKEIVLLKEVLAGKVSLPVVANDGIFLEGVEKLEALASNFGYVAEQQIDRLERISENLSPNNELVEIKDDDLPQGILFADLMEPEKFKTEEEPAISFSQDLPHPLHQRLILASPLSEIKLPGVGRNILEKKFDCKTVHDVLKVMLKHKNRDALLGIPLLGLESVHALEVFMIQEGLLKLDKIDGDYVSEYYREV